MKVILGEWFAGGQVHLWFADGHKTHVMKGIKSILLIPFACHFSCQQYDFGFNVLGEFQVHEMKCFIFKVLQKK